MRLFNVTGQRAAFSKEYSGTAANPRVFAHTISDEIHKQQRNLTGVARTKLTFSSDRDGERMQGTVYNARIKEIYIADYDGANPRRITVNRSLNINPVWSSDGKAIAYTSYRRNNFPDIFVQRIYEGTPPESPAGGTDRIHNFLPAWSPDGTKIAFMTNRDGNQEIYVMDPDGSNLRRITRHPAHRHDADLVAGRQPDRLHVGSLRHAADLHRRRRRARPAAAHHDQRELGRPRHLVAGAVQRDRLRGAIRARLRHQDLRRGERRRRGSITNGEGINESPAFSPTGRHIAFTSTRAGNEQIFVVGRDGNGLKQVTKEGNNFTPELVALTRTRGSTRRRTRPCHAIATHAPVFFAIALAAGGAGARAKKKPPVARPTPPPPDSDATAGARRRRPSRSPRRRRSPCRPNRRSSRAPTWARSTRSTRHPRSPVFFEFDSAEMSGEAQAVLAKNAEMMKRYPTWVVSIEGHCDERGTAEYNLALGERRALSVRSISSRSALPPSGCAR